MNVPKIRFNDFDDNISKISIKELGNVITGTTPSTADRSNYGDEYLWASPVDMGDFKYINNTKTKLSEKGFNKTRCVPKDSILITCIGSTIGKTGMASKEMSTNQQINTLIPNKNYNSDYLYYCINFNFPRFLNKISFQAVPIISKSEFEKLEVSITKNIYEQEKIGNMLSLIDKKIELQSKKIEDLKLFKKGLSNKVFSTIKVEKEEKLGDICNITTGKLDANAMVENGQYRFYTCAKDYYYIDKYAFDTEALLISGNGAYVGYIHYYKGKFNAYQRTYVLDQFTENIQYIKIYLDEFLSKRINSEKKEGNTPYIVLSTLSDMKIKITNSTDENIVINTFNNINIKIKKEESKLNKLIELKKGLMQNMFV